MWNLILSQYGSSNLSMLSWYYNICLSLLVYLLWLNKIVIFPALFFLQQLQNSKLREENDSVGRVLWNVLVFPWKLLFAFVPPYQIAHGWIAFICSLIFISGIAYIVTRFTDLISCVTGLYY